VIVTSVSSAAFRRRFPMLAERVHLASCSLGARSDALDCALARMLEAMHSGAAAWAQFGAEAQEARRLFAALIGARPERIALVPNASTGAFQAVSTLALTERTTIVTSAHEFPSIAHVWLAQRARGARVSFVEAAATDHADRYADAIDAGTALVSVPLVTYADGSLLPAAEIVRVARARGAATLVDAYQGVGVVPVDVEELGCDFLVAGAQKYLLGLPGIAFLYVRDGAATERDPVLTGWWGRVDPFAFDARRLDFPADARRFETGTPAVAALYAATAGASLLADIDPHEVRRHTLALGRLAAERLTAQGEHVPLAPDAVRGAHVAMADADPEGMASFLDRHGISVSPRGTRVRLSFHYYNNEDDVETVCQAIESYRATTARRCGHQRARGG
jgi:selenocysteine lyase/cysteine desulfurase